MAVTNIIDSGAYLVNVVLPNEVERARIAAEQALQISLAANAALYAPNGYVLAAHTANFTSGVTAAHAAKAAALAATAAAVAAGRKSAHR